MTAAHDARQASGVTDRVLLYWHRKGWLGMPHPGTGVHLPWDNPKVAVQIDWLRRLQASGRTLDDEDAAAGWRLRAAGASVAIRALGGWIDAKRWGSLPTDPYCLAVVRP